MDDPDRSIHVLSPYTLKILCGAEAFDSALLLSAGHPESYASATCAACLKAAPKVERPAPIAPREQPRPQPVRHNDTLGRAGRIADADKRIKVERKREMTEKDRRRILLEGADPQSAQLDVIAPGPFTDEETGERYTLDEQGERVPVVQRDDNRGLQYLDGKSEPRPPREWEDLEADFRGAVHVNTLEDVMDELRAKRAATPIYERIHDAMREIGKLQTQRARAMPENELDAIRATGGDKSQAPQGEPDSALAFSATDEVTGRLQQILLHTEAIEDLLDAHHGRTVKSYVLMGQEEKDALLTGPRLRGLTPEEIHALHPKLGVPRTIRGIRKQFGQDARGNPRPAVAAA